MRVSHLYATFVAVVTGLVLCLSAHAQGQPQGQTQAATTASSTRHGTNVAVIDIKFIFDNHQAFKAAMEEIKKDYEAFEGQVRETENTLRKQIEELKALTPGSEQFKRLEEQIAQTRTQVQLDINRKQKQRVESEALLYHRAFERIEEHIGQFADRYGIDLVLQFSQSEIDPTKPDTVIRGLNRLVVFQRNLNITGHILQELNRQSPPVGTTGVNNRGTVVPNTTRLPGSQTPGKSLR